MFAIRPYDAAQRVIDAAWTRLTEPATWCALLEAVRADAALELADPALYGALLVAAALAAQESVALFTETCMIAERRYLRLIGEAREALMDTAPLPAHVEADAEAALAAVELWMTSEWARYIGADRDVRTLADALAHRIGYYRDLPETRAAVVRETQDAAQAELDAINARIATACAFRDAVARATARARETSALRAAIARAEAKAA